jgi:hypothetical protein
MKKPTGFPNTNYTGIPEMRHRLQHSAAPERERHLNVLLNTLNDMLNDMKAWLTKDWKQPRESAESLIFEEPLKKLKYVSQVTQCDQCLRC